MSQIIDESDQVVINGDFYDGYIISFDEFVKSEWAKLFPKLRKKKTTYLWGNHDREDFADSRVKLFSETRQQNLILKTRKKEIVIEHGNKFLPFIDEKINRKFIPKSFAQHSLDFESFLVKRFGTGLINKMYKIYNSKMKHKIMKNTKDNQILICGHTHMAEIDLTRRFINSGMVNYGLGQYLLIENDEIEDREVWYETPFIEDALDPSLYYDQTQFISPRDLNS